MLCDKRINVAFKKKLFYLLCHFFSKLLNVLLGPGAIKERKKEMEIERKEVNLNRIKDGRERDRGNFEFF